MPLYEYECAACHKRTEKIQKFSDPEITVCPKCGGDLERVISAPAIAFKGGGWFADGYGNARPQASGSNEGSTAEGSGSAGSASPESKPAADIAGAPSNAAAPAPAGAPAASAPASPASAKS